MYKHILFRLVALQLLLIPNLGYTQPFNHYYGNIHAHTSYSDGNKDHKKETPAEAFAFAKKSKRMDFLGVSEHNHTKAGFSHDNFAKGLQQAKESNEDEKFVCVYGMEFGVIKNGGHVLIYDFDKVIGWEPGEFDVKCEQTDYTKLWKLISEKDGAFATLAHPQKVHFDNLISNPYSETADKAICGVAIANGPHSSEAIDYTEVPRTQYYAYYKRLLAKGYHVGPTIDHDNHNTTFGRTTEGRTVILAKKLTRKDVLDAYRAMRFYATQDFNAKVDFTVAGKPMGSSLVTNSAHIKATISDADNETFKSVKVMYGNPGSDDLPEVFITPDNPKNFDYVVQLEPGESIYLYLEIIQEDGDKIVTAPIWLESPEEEF